MDDNNELIIYVLQQLRQGVPEQAVRTTLAQNGWPQPLIDRAFSMVQQARPHEVPPTSYTGQPTPQQFTNTQPAALPSPEENKLPRALTPSKPEKRSHRGLFIALTILVILAVIGSAVAFFILRSNEKIATNTPNTTEQKSVDIDIDRKNNLNTLASGLSEYFNAKQSYPTLAGINDPQFAKTEKGFDIAKSKDPSWDAKKSKCVSKDGTPIFAESRTDGCYTYRSTAMNGGDCNGADIKCTRVVLTATLKDKKPYVVALDQNKREE